MDTEYRARARDLGLMATNMPAELGGGGCSMLQQVLVQEQVGRVTNALAWMLSTPPSWFAPVATEYQLERWLKPAVRGEGAECYAITEECAGSDVDAIEATARREGDEYVLDGIKWHVTSYNEATWGFFQAKLTDPPHAGEHAMFIFDIPTPGVSVVRTPAYTHTIAHHHPILAFEGVRVPASHLVGEEGGGMAFAYEWFRFERFMVAARCLGAAERLVDEATAFAKERVASGRPIIEHQLDPGHARRQPDRAVCGTLHALRVCRQRQTAAPTSRFSTRTHRWRSSTRRRWRTVSPTVHYRSSAGAATCARTWRSGSSVSCG